jgi:hypothetical protein
MTTNITFASVSTCNVNGTDGAVKESFPFLWCTKCQLIVNLNLPLCIYCVYMYIMAPAHESETIVFNIRKLLSTFPNYAELEQILLFSVNWGKQVWIHNHCLSGWRSLAFDERGLIKAELLYTIHNSHKTHQYEMYKLGCNKKLWVFANCPQLTYKITRL